MRMVPAMARKLGQARRRVMATPNYFAKHGEPKSPAELIAHQTVIYTPEELWAVYPTGRMASAKAREFASFVESCIPTTQSESLKRPLTA